MVRLTYDFDSWDGATITASSEASTDLADDNIIHDHVAQVWRTSSDASEWIKFDLGSAKQITCFGMFNFNLTSSATVTLQANASDSWGSPSYSQALTIATDADGTVLERLVLYLDETYRWWRVTFDDSGNSDGYLQVGRIAAGAYWQPTRSYSEGFGFQMVDPSLGSQPPGTQGFFRKKKKYREARVNFEMLGQTDADKWLAVFDKVGNTEPIILSLDPSNRPSKDSIYSYLKTPLKLSHRLAEQFQLIALAFEEKVA